jgi:hypothetical protein
MGWSVTRSGSSQPPVTVSRKGARARIEGGEEAGKGGAVRGPARAPTVPGVRVVDVVRVARPTSADPFLPGEPRQKVHDCVPEVQESRTVAGRTGPGRRLLQLDPCLRVLDATVRDRGLVRLVREELPRGEERSGRLQLALSVLRGGDVASLLALLLRRQSGSRRQSSSQDGNPREGQDDPRRPPVLRRRTRPECWVGRPRAWRPRGSGRLAARLANCQGKSPAV